MFVLQGEKSIKRGGSSCCVHLKSKIHPQTHQRGSKPKNQPEKRFFVSLSHHWFIPRAAQWGSVPPAPSDLSVCPALDRENLAWGMSSQDRAAHFAFVSLFSSFGIASSLFLPSLIADFLFLRLFVRYWESWLELPNLYKIHPKSLHCTHTSHWLIEHRPDFFFYLLLLLFPQYLHPNENQQLSPWILSIYTNYINGNELAMKIISIYHKYLFGISDSWTAQVFSFMRQE